MKQRRMMRSSLPQEPEKIYFTRWKYQRAHCWLSSRTGKTLLAKAMAGEAQVPILFSINGSILLSVCGVGASEYGISQTARDKRLA